MKTISVFSRWPIYAGLIAGLLLQNIRSVSGQERSRKEPNKGNQADDDGQQPSSRSITFDSDRAEALPDGFSEWLTAGGGPVKWRVVVADDAPSGKQVVAQLSKDDTDTRYPLLVLDDFSAKDVDVSVRFKTISGKVDQAAGIVWRYQDKDNYFIARANALEDNVVIYKTVGGKRSSIGIKGDPKAYGVKSKVPPHQWNTLRVRMVGAAAEVYLNDNKLIEVENETFNDAGKIGLWTKADSVTQFDDLTINSLDADADDQRIGDENDDEGPDGKDGGRR